MADKFFIQPIEQLFQRMVTEEKSGQLFGVPRSLFFTPADTDVFRMQRYGRMLETPIGVASGPHTQMTQNIITAWLTGARYIELKTVQTLDELNVTKPCIDLEDEGYNCEWSQELKLLQSYDQYLNAWILIHLLRHKWGWDHSQQNPQLGCLFNMSVGYNMEGMLKPNVQEFLAKMENCKPEKEAKLERLATLYPAVKDLVIPDAISNHITLSTMHGCPPDEIEKIGLYLIKERCYHTTIKLNPTLLGPERLRDILNNKLGFQTEVPDQAFGHDLKYPDALNLIRSLQTAASQKGVDFNLKLTNTLEAVNFRQVFPAHETMMYMSGRALHPISIQLAARLQREFNGTLDLSFSAGIDCFNIAPVMACGIRPVTVCSDILKPGGYGRLFQYLQHLAEAIKTVKADSIDNYILNTYHTHHPGHPETQIKAAALANLEEYAQQVVANPRYQKTVATGQSIKINRELSAFDCIQAPCLSTCPAHQAIPDYMHYTATGNYAEALATILKTNPFPTVTGLVCDHICMTACTRLNYDEPLQIREIKRFIAQQVQAEPVLTPAPATGVTAAIIGAGPSGLACAYFLALQGVAVEVYEAKNLPGGMVASAIPAFRLKEEDIRNDIARIQKLGVTIHYNRKIDKPLFKALRERVHFVYVAVGAQVASHLNIAGENAPGVTDALSFLARVRAGETPDLGKRVAIIGGGNSAVDAARTAWRLGKDQQAQVVMLYRRSRAQMPAEAHEIKALLEEGIAIHELTNPVKITATPQGLTLLCAKMQLGEPDDSGRRRPVKIEGADFELHFDSVISAIGQQVVLDLLDEPMTPDPASVRLGGMDRITNVFIGGDALHGAFNIITAIADGKKAADTMLGTLPTALTQSVQRGLPLSEYQHQSATRLFGPHPGELPVATRQNFEPVIQPLSETAARAEASRCLLCSDVCNVCVTVCPNRANFSYTLPPISYEMWRFHSKGKGLYGGGRYDDFHVTQPYQILNIADYCNECGNCATFCPTAGAPYKDKPKLCLTESAFEAETDAFFLGYQQDQLFLKRKYQENNQINIETMTMTPSHFLYHRPGVEMMMELDTFKLEVLEITAPSGTRFNMESAAAMSLILRYAAPQLGFC